MSRSIVDLFGNRPNPASLTRNFNAYAAGNKTYNGGRSFPNMGPVSGQGMGGYAERDNKAKARKSAIMRRMSKQTNGIAPNSFGSI